MTRNSIRSKVSNILRRYADDGDAEIYGRAELRLYQSVLRAAAQGHPEAIGMAREALRLAIKGRRYFA